MSRRYPYFPGAAVIGDPSILQDPIDYLNHRSKFIAICGKLGETKPNLYQCMPSNRCLMYRVTIASTGVTSVNHVCGSMHVTLRWRRS